MCCVFRSTPYLGGVVTVCQVGADWLVVSLYTYTIICDDDLDVYLAWALRALVVL